MAHTPGPWIWEAQDESMTLLCQKDEHGMADLEHSVLWVVRCKACQKDPERQLCGMPNEANARLIAAAPELLDIAKRVAAECDETFIDPDEMSPEFREIYRDCQAAIAKAEGGLDP